MNILLVLIAHHYSYGLLTPPSTPYLVHFAWSPSEKQHARDGRRRQSVQRARRRGRNGIWRAVLHVQARLHRR
ncbi:hypothetical protein FIBSPDRAFT_170457 [Athelia psychrophila]|uniref:Uncharacterized protein n=1 Tax=Athelia psychrophila TaxID=1759441 RepID=A0A166AX36_9AGAM|nr:hypothetical protein FIBSPDRAFT_170457 [Fibularhizoctonia sp. CBS 109695]